MIIHNKKQDSILQNTILFFTHYVIKCDLTSYFEIDITDNILVDYLFFTKSKKPIVGNECAGTTIPPYKRNGKIQILISQNYCTPDVILHELAHMYDFVLFSRYFCNNKLHKVLKHKYFQTFVYWTEFHVKQIDIPYLHLLLDMYNNVSKEKYLLNFKSQIKTFYYPKYNEKFLSKVNIEIRDVMWYLGELLVCNIYDENNTYSISQEILNIYGSEIIELYNLTNKCSTFEDYVINAEEFFNYFS